MLTNNAKWQTFTEDIEIGRCIRQGNPLNHFLLNLAMDEIVEKLPSTLLDSTRCATLMTQESKDDLQRLLRNFNQEANRPNMKININNTTCMVATKDPRK